MTSVKLTDAEATVLYEFFYNMDIAVLLKVLGSEYSEEDIVELDKILDNIYKQLGNYR